MRDLNSKWKKNTGVFLFSQAISLLGSSLVQFAITSYITIQTKSGLYATIAILCAVLPTFFLSPFAGVWADKYDRRKLIMLADAGIALCTLVVAVIFLSGHGSLALLYIALIIRALGSAVQMPCVSALLPDIVPEEHLGRINGINGSVQALSGLASPMLGALLLGLVPLGMVFFVDIITALIAILIMLLAFRLPQKEGTVSAETSGHYLDELKSGFRYILNTRFLRLFFLFCVADFILMAPVVFLTQVQVARNYGGDYWYLSAMEVAFSVGMLIGGVVISVWGGFKNKIQTMVLSVTAMGVCTFALGIRMPFVPYILLMGLFGVAMPFLNTPAITFLQEKTDSRYTGRVFGVLTMINTSMMPLGMLIFGPFADIVSIEVLLLFTGVIVIFTAFLMARSKTLRQAGA